MEVNQLKEAKEKLISTLEEIMNRELHDEERDHSDADDALLDFALAMGCPEAWDIFEKIEKWYA